MVLLTSSVAPRGSDSVYIIIRIGLIKLSELILAVDRIFPPYRILRITSELYRGPLEVCNMRDNKVLFKPTI
jgi:hypothetical protein